MVSSVLLFLSSFLQQISFKHPFCSGTQFLGVEEIAIYKDETVLIYLHGVNILIRKIDNKYKIQII